MPGRTALSMRTAYAIAAIVIRLYVIAVLDAARFRIDRIHAQIRFGIEFSQNRRIVELRMQMPTSTLAIMRERILFILLALLAHLNRRTILREMIVFLVDGFADIDTCTRVLDIELKASGTSRPDLILPMNPILIAVSYDALFLQIVMIPSFSPAGVSATLRIISSLVIA